MCMCYRVCVMCMCMCMCMCHVYVYVLCDLSEIYMYPCQDIYKYTQEQQVASGAAVDGLCSLYVAVCVNIFVVAVWFLPFKPSSSVTRAGVNIYIYIQYVC